MSETKRLRVTAAQYVNVSAGEANCYLMGEFKELRLVIAGEEPDADAPDYIVLTDGKPVALGPLSVGDRVWVRAEDADEEVSVIRGPVRMR